MLEDRKHEVLKHSLLLFCVFWCLRWGEIRRKSQMVCGQEVMCTCHSVLLIVVIIWNIFVLINQVGISSGDPQTNLTDVELTKTETTQLCKQTQIRHYKMNVRVYLQWNKSPEPCGHNGSKLSAIVPRTLLSEASSLQPDGRFGPIYLNGVRWRTSNSDSESSFLIGLRLKIIMCAVRPTFSQPASQTKKEKQTFWFLIPRQSDEAVIQRKRWNVSPAAPFSLTLSAFLKNVCVCVWEMSCRLSRCTLHRRIEPTECVCGGGQSYNSYKRTSVSPSAWDSSGRRQAGRPFGHIVLTSFLTTATTPPPQYKPPVTPHSCPDTCGCWTHTFFTFRCFTGRKSDELSGCAAAIVRYCVCLTLF